MTLSDHQLHEVTRAVAEHMPSPWTFALGSDDERSRIVHPDGMSIFLFPDNRVVGDLPPGILQRYAFSKHADDADIGVTLTRPPQAIAREIQRRLLPTYVPIFHLARETISEEQRDSARQEALQARLDAANPDRAKYPFSANYPGHTVTIRASVPAQLAFALLDVLRDHLADGGESR